LNWDDEVLAKTALTHAGKLHSDKTEQDAYPSNKADKAATKSRAGKAAVKAA
jgi:hypothetical protein